MTASIVSPDGRGRTQYATEELIYLDLVQLRQHVLEVDTYGRLLTKMVFANQELRRAWDKSHASADALNVPLRLRLHFPHGERDIQMLYWETLLDPDPRIASPLAQQPRTLIMRSLNGFVPVRSPLPPSDSLRSLVVIANPNDLHQYGLARLDETDIARIGTAAEIAGATVLVGARTLDNLTDALDDGFDVLYLLCHGRQPRDSEDTYFWFEDAQGLTDRISARQIAALLGGLEAAPTMVILASCESAGVNHEPVPLTAAEQILISTGTSAVVGQQGLITVDSAVELIITLIKELRQDGRIDRAMAVVRRRLQHSSDWWRLVLLTRITDGRVAQPQMIAETPYHARAPLEHIVGRNKEVAQLVEALRRNLSLGKLAVGSVSGMPGVGKTELALLVAQQLLSELSDPPLILNMRSSQQEPREALWALRQIVQALLPGARLPEELEALQELYRSAVRGRRLLIIADDLQDSSQARALLPPPGSALLITSRVRLVLTEMSPDATLNLSPLTQTEATALALALCPRLAGEAEHLVRLCGGLPLAIRVACGLLASDQTRLVAQFLDQLTDERTRLAHFDDATELERSLRITLLHSVQALPTNAYNAMSALGVFPAPFDRAAARTVLGVDSDDADKTLSLLFQRNLILYETHTDRFELHTLVRALTHTMRSPEADSRARGRHARWYQNLAHEAAFHLRGKGQAKWLADLDAAEDHVEAALAWYWGQGEWQATALLTGAMVDYWDTRGRFARGKYWLEDRLLNAAPVPDERLLAEVQNNAGMLAIGSGEDNSAEQLLSASLRTLHRQSLDREAAPVFVNLSAVRLRRGDLAGAARFAKTVFRLAQCSNESPQIAAEGAALLNLGVIALHGGALGQAAKLLRRALGVKRQFHDQRGIARALVNIGQTATYQKDYRSATRYLEAALYLYNEVDDTQGKAVTLSYSANAAFRSGDEQGAWSYYDRAIAYVAALRDAEVLIACLEGLAALTATHIERISEAAHLIRLADALRAERGWPHPPLTKAAQTALRARVAAAPSWVNVATSSSQLFEQALASLESTMR